MALACSGCGSSSSGSTATTSNKYEQTWPKNYDQTTCTEFNEQMTAQQKFAAAADMLTSARNKGDGGTGLPSDELIRQFQDDINEACSIQATADTLTLADTGASIYLIGRAQYQP